MSKKKIIVSGKEKEVQPKKAERNSDEWYTTGEKAYEKKGQLDIAAKMRKEKFASRFLIKPDENNVIIVFVDDTAFAINEHVRWTGKQTQYITCTKDFNPPCVVCDSGERAMFTVYFTVIDTRQFTRKDGVAVKNRKVLFPAKGSSIKRIEELRKKKGSLAGLAVKVKRFTSDEPNCGSDFNAVKKIDLLKNFGKDSDKPIDYKKVLAPPTEEELASLGFGIASVVGVKPESSIDKEEDDLSGLI